MPRATRQVIVHRNRDGIHSSAHPNTKPCETSSTHAYSGPQRECHSKLRVRHTAACAELMAQYYPDSPRTRHRPDAKGAVQLALVSAFPRRSDRPDKARARIAMYWWLTTVGVMQCKHAHSTRPTASRSELLHVASKTGVEIIPDAKPRQGQRRPSVTRPLCTQYATPRSLHLLMGWASLTSYA